MRLDPEVLGLLREAGGDELVRKLHKTFVEHAPERLANLARAAASRDIESLMRAGHSLRSAAAMLGADGLSVLAARFEALAQTGALEKTLGALPELERSVRELSAQLAAEVSEYSGGMKL